MNEGYITITDTKGAVHQVTAAKPKDSDPKYWFLLTVIHMTGTLRTPYVVHTLNLQTGGFHDGAYCEDLVTAIGIFNRR